MVKTLRECSVRFKEPIILLSVRFTCPLLLAPEGEFDDVQAVAAECGLVQNVHAAAFLDEYRSVHRLWQAFQAKRECFGKL